MAVGSDTNRISYTVTSASSSPLAVDFRFDEPGWLNVYYVEDNSETASLLVLGTDYSIGGDGDTITGTVTLTAPFLASIGSGQLTIARLTPAFQSLDLEYNTRLPSASLEKALDWQAMALQDRDPSPGGIGGRSIVMPVTEPDGNSNILAIPNARKGKPWWGNPVTGALEFAEMEDFAPAILAYYGLTITSDDVLAAISAIAPLFRATPPDSTTYGKGGQLAIVPRYYGVTVSGTLSPDATGPLLPWKTDGDSVEKVWFTTTGEDPSDSIDTVYQIGWTNVFTLTEFDGGVITGKRWIALNGNSGADASGVTSWLALGGATGSPSVAATDLVPARVWVNLSPTDEVPEWMEILSEVEILSLIDRGKAALEVPAQVSSGSYPPAGALDPGSTVFVFNEPDGRSGKILSIDIYLAASGDFEIHKVKVLDDGTWVTTGMVDWTGTGTNELVTLYPGLDFPDDWHLDSNESIALNPVTGTYTFSNSIGAQGYWYRSNGTIPNPITGLTLTAGGALHVRVNLESKMAVRYGESVIDSAPSIPFLPEGWTNTSSLWTFSPGSGYAQSGTVGIANRLITATPCGADERRIEVEFSLSSLSTIAIFCTTPSEGINSGSQVRINATNNRIEIMTAYAGDGTAGTVIAYKDISPALVAGRKYLFVWEKSGRSFTASLQTPAKSIIKSITREATPLGYSTYPTFGYDQGAMQGKLSFAVSAGVMRVYSVRHLSLTLPNPQLYILGDSILEGFAVGDSVKFGALIRDAIGSDSVMISGIGGAVTSTAFTRLKSELKTIQPRNILIFLGTNTDASFSANLSSIVLWLRRRGIRIYVATVPTSSANTTIVNALPAWVTKIPFDVVMTTGGAGTPLIEELYELIDGDGTTTIDALHPGVAGHAVLADCFFNNAPEILNIP